MINSLQEVEYSSNKVTISNALSIIDEMKILFEKEQLPEFQSMKGKWGVRFNT